MKPIVRPASLLIITTCLWQNCSSKPPKATVIFVVDQCAYDYFPTLLPYMKGGIAHLAHNGVFYTNAYFPHAMPETSTGHAGLNTGTTASYHGITQNSWQTQSGTWVDADDDTADNARVFYPTGGSYNYGKSASKICVDGISDQHVLSSTRSVTRRSISISLKSYAAICAAGQSGCAFWLDSNQLAVTSSKAYLPELPEWVTAFNKRTLEQYKTLTPWMPLFDLDDAAYDYFDPRTYQFTRKPTLIGTNPTALTGRDWLKYFKRTPAANELILSFASTIIDTHVTTDKDDTLLLWVCLSALDNVGHTYGPNSLETIDMLYRLDLQLAPFIHSVEERFGSNNVLMVLTADHGMAPMTELLQTRGSRQARRIMSDELIVQLNRHVASKFGIAELVTAFESSQFYLNLATLAHLDQPLKNEIMMYLKQLLCDMPGIKRAWSYQELDDAQNDDAFIDCYKKQLYPGRNGHIIVQPAPYTMISDEIFEASHETPYCCDTHVPLIVYQPGMTEHKITHETVSPLQLATTLAHLLEIPNPSACTRQMLPGLFACSGKT